jgi:hypothetical protein
LISNVSFVSHSIRLTLSFCIVWLEYRLSIVCVGSIHWQ